MNQHFTHTVSPIPMLFADYHTFSAKERDPETGLSYFGSRYYSSDLSIWLSVDPMSDKYPSLSPYVYCADNPVRLVDPNGEEIYVGDFIYNNGKLYSKDGKEFVPINNSFEEKALQSLNTLRGTKKGNELMTPFEGNTGKDVRIIDAINRKGNQKGKSGVGDVVCNYNTMSLQSATIYWNPEGNILPTTNGFLRNATTDLGHEFSHVYDLANGKTYWSGVHPISSPLETEEWMAVYRENLIRSELNLPYRTNYGYSINSWNEREPTKPDLLQNGNPFFPEHLLKSTFKSAVDLWRLTVTR